MVTVLICLACMAPAADFVNYYSPHNSERPERPRTDFIVLHTTEGPTEGSLRKIWENGEAHFYIDLAGRIYRIVRLNLVAFHAGRSMWLGRTDIDNYSIGIEFTGYHNRDLTPQQYAAGRELVSILQKQYKISDDRVLTHSMVAYSTPNRWHRRPHRGRKRCGMIFAQTDVRKRLGLADKPLYDPDVKAGRLIAADPYLARYLYSGSGSRPTEDFAKVAKKEGESSTENAGKTEPGSGKTPPPSSSPAVGAISKERSAWDIAGSRYNAADTIYRFPDGKEYRGNQIRDWKKVPVGTKVTVLTPELCGNEPEGVRRIGEDGDTALDVAGDEYDKTSTYYFFPDGRVKSGDQLGEKGFQSMPSGTKVLVGYTCAGTVTSKKSAFDICGKRWNFPSTFYRLPDGTTAAGNTISEKSIPPKTMIFYAN